ncbi:hypothetical protein BCR39DRAFT_539899 [Naematelia encephala]|uniref:DH domain-containing protein n=1 Tax=Naematelia encephala TaxID=71784 RepID=A0A1Y2AYB6_9TREE|nr:hypothetical protein BCR39DRAFT_539899 [Naematelia encephala]
MSFQTNPTAAGPSRSFNSSLPPIIPSQTSSPSFSPIGETYASPWQPNGFGTMAMPEPHRSDTMEDKGEGSKRNPLVDLIDTEKTYVEQLALVIRRVAGAWSRKDFPPPKLDAMFRCVESVYRANRAFGAKLKEIGPTPSSPKALGDLLMRWIDDLEPAYRKYTSTFLTGFDLFAPVTRNALLPNILTEISSTCPPTPPLTSWSLDALFILPYTRLRYYRKLYARLLRSTKEGRSDHRLLLGANQRLESLVNEVESRLEMDVTEEDGPEVSVSAPGSSGERSREPSWAEKERVSRTSSAMDSSMDSATNFSPFSSRIEDPRNSGGSAATSITQSPQRLPAIVPNMTPAQNAPSPTSASAPLSDLELRINTERTLDLFSMKPKMVTLQMNPPSLPFSRFLRSSHDVAVNFTPNSTGQQVIHQRAHVFILSDLFLVAEWMEASDKAAKAQLVAKEQPERMGLGGPMPEMWLMYPPLAGKHLTVAEGAQSNVLVVTVMRKETFMIHAENEVARDQMIKDMIDCIDFAASASRRTTSLTSPTNDARSPSSHSDGRSTESTFPPLRYPSPFSTGSSPSVSPRPGDPPEMPPPPPIGGNALVTQMSKISLQPGETVAWARRPSPPPGQPLPPLPTPPESVSVLPPRGASLRQARQPSGNLPIPQRPPQMPNQAYGHNSDPSLGPTHGAPLPRSPSGRSVQSAPRQGMVDYDAPPVPQFRGPGSHLSDGAGGGLSAHHLPSRSRSAEPLRPPLPAEPPSARFSSFPANQHPADHDDISPPMSPVEEETATLTGPAIISAQMKCKVFLKQGHQQWKSLGAGKLKLYAQQTGSTKQLVVESDSSSKAMLISTIVLTDGVERVAKTGVAVEISDRGKRTGIVYMIQLRNENSAAGLFESLLAGSDRAAGRQ